MPTTITNVFLDFDNTQFDGHLHNILSNYIKRYQDNHIENLSKKRLIEELSNEGPISEESKIAILKALALFKEDPKLGKGSLDFFNAEKLNAVVGELKKVGANVMVLTASSYPNAVRAMYEMRELSNLQNLTIHSVPVSIPDQMAIDKSEKIQAIEKVSRKNFGYDNVINFFVDDNKKNIDEFEKGRDKKFNIGIHAKNGMTENVFASLKALVAFNKPTILTGVPKLNNQADTGKVKQQSKSYDDLSDISGKAGNKGLLTQETKQKSKSNEDLLAKGFIKNNKNNKDSDIYGKVSSKGVLTTSKEKYTEAKPNLFHTLKGIFKNEKKKSEASPNIAHGSRSIEDFLKMTEPVNKNQQRENQSSNSTVAKTQNQSQTVDKTKGAIPKKVGPQVAPKPKFPKP